MNIQSIKTDDKATLFNTVKKELLQHNYTISREDKNRPWGGFFVIDEGQAIRFIKQFFPRIDSEKVINGEKLSPKILLVAPNKRLSWQYHFRRSEVWSVEAGEVGVCRSMTDEQNEVEIFKEDDWLILKQGERHRLIGLDDWAIVAEIWQHTDAENPSDENDIIRLEDDFGR
ncbi:MAG: phosphoheptose isomerase [Saprospiraceae bacterium]